MTGRSPAADLRRARLNIRRYYNQATLDLAEKMHLDDKHDTPENWMRTCPLCRAFVVRRARRQ